AFHPAHQRRRQCRHTPRGHRRRGLQNRGLAARGRRPAADAEAVSDLQRGVDGSAARAPAPLDSPGHAAVSRRRVSRLRDDGLPRPLLDSRDSDEYAGAALAARRPGAHGLPASKVLLVDDEDSLRKVMRDLLERDGYVVTEARDGVQALDQVDRVGPDIIVLDLNLPGLDGYGVLSHLRSRPATANIPVIVLTAKGDEDNEVRVFELGADDFLTKPFRARALSARLEAVLGRRR